MNSNTVAKFEILDPTAGLTTGKGVLSPRLDSLDGKILGVIWNRRPGGDLILNRTLDILKKKHDIKDVVFRAKPYIGNPAPKEIIDELAARCDAVIAGLGD